MNQSLIFFLILCVFWDASSFVIQSDLEPDETSDRVEDGCRNIKCNEGEKEKKKVCGSDGSFYDSICEVKLDSCKNGVNVTIESEGNCLKSISEISEEEGTVTTESEQDEVTNGMEQKDCPQVCLGIQDPVCGSDGQIYPNVCLMNKRNCGKKLKRMEMRLCFARARQGRTLSDDPCAIQCLETYRPVCGSDGNLYQNECYMRRETCKSEFKVVSVPLSICIATPRCPRNCLPIHDPTCGSDGRMYLNTCKMKADTCYGKKVRKVDTSFCLKNSER